MKRKLKPKSYDKGLPKYSEGGYKEDLPGSIYILVSGSIVKIGITNRKVSSRCAEISRASGMQFTEVYSRRDTDGRIPKEIECILLKKVKDNGYLPLEKFAGYTECFANLDVSELIEEVNYLSYELNS